MSDYGFFPAPGTDYTVGDEPTLADRLNRLGQALKRHLIGISGYRTPAHSVAVGGFADDPHTRGQASDTPGTENIPEATLERFGLTRPFPGAAEADHIQLLGTSSQGTRGTTTVRPRGRQAGGGNTPADWLRQGGWPSNLIPIMVAIGGAESHWNIAAVNHNTNGTTDYGWLQINSVHGFDAARLQSDPVYTASAGWQVYKEQGLAAWSTYTNGAYRQFMGQAPTLTNSASPIVRPGGESNPDDPGTELASFWGTVGKLNPLTALLGASKAVNSATDFLKWIAWIFHPLNILRVVEFLVGFPLIILGLWTIMAVWRDAKDQTPMAIAGRTYKKGVGLAISAAAPEAAVASKAATVARRRTR